MSEEMGFTSAVLTPDTTVTGLSGGERQGLAIVRALHFEADIIILDEPTMGLSLKETEKLLHFVDGIRDKGKSAIFIDHNIFHVYSVADRIVILDRGRVAGEFPTSRYSLNELMDIMREVASTGRFHADRSQVANGASAVQGSAQGRRGRRHEHGGGHRAQGACGSQPRRRVRQALGVADRHHRRLPAALARLHHPGAGDVHLRPHLQVVRADGALLRHHGHGAHDGHRGRGHRPLVPLDHGPRHGRLRVDLGRHRRTWPWRRSRRWAWAPARASSTASWSR